MLSSLNLKLKVYFKKFKDVNYRKGVSTLVGACFINFLAGAIFSLCTLSVYEISYIKAKGGSITIDHLTFYYPIEIIFQCVSAFFSGNIYTKFGLHITNLIGTTVLTLGYFTMFISSSLFLDLLAMIIGGIGTGIIFYPSTTNAYEWFKDNTGVIVGVMETMISFGSFFFAFIGEKIINNDEIPSNNTDNLYDFQIGKRIKLYLVIQMIALVSAFIISYFLMHVKVEEDLLKDLAHNSHIIEHEVNIEDLDTDSVKNINTNIITSTEKENDDEKEEKDEEKKEKEEKEEKEEKDKDKDEEEKKEDKKKEDKEKEDKEKNEEKEGKEEEKEKDVEKENKKDSQEDENDKKEEKDVEKDKEDKEDEKEDKEKKEINEEKKDVEDNEKSNEIKKDNDPNKEKKDDSIEKNENNEKKEDLLEDNSKKKKIMIPIKMKKMKKKMKK